MNEVFVSTGAVPGRSVAEILDLCEESGIQRLELSSGLRCSDREIEHLHARRASGMVYLLHNYFPAPSDPIVLNLAASDPALLERSRSHCRGAIDLCVALSSPFYSVHAGFAVDPSPHDLGRPLTRTPRSELDAAHRRFVASIRELADYAVARSVRFLVENHVLASFNLVNGENRVLLGVTAEDLLRTLRDVDHPAVGLLIDVGHLKVSAKTLGFDADAFLDAVAPHVEAFHLSDNDGSADTNETFDSSAWFVDRLRAFPDTVLSVEVYGLKLGDLVALVDMVHDVVAAA